MPTWLIIAAGALIIASFYFRSRAARVQPIASPKVRLIDLDDGKHSAVLNEDRAWLTRLFADVGDAFPAGTHCDVLFIYGDISPDGSWSRSAATLGQMIAAAGASVVVVATPNTPEAYMAASKQGGSARANLVMTLDRKGPAFAQFFEALFADMKKGTGMPVAWVKLAPQGPVEEHDRLPETIFTCGAGQIAFA